MRHTTFVRSLVRSLVIGLSLALCSGSLRADERPSKLLNVNAPAPIAADRILFQARLDGIDPAAEGSAEARPAAIALQLQLFDQPTDGRPLGAPTVVTLEAASPDQIQAELALDAAAAEGGERWIEAALVEADGAIVPLMPRHALGGASRMAHMEGAGVSLSGMTWRAAATDAVAGATTDGASNASPDGASNFATGAVTDSAVDPASYGEFMNLSTRGYVGLGDNVMIAGFIVDAPTVVMVRALGPSLAASGVPGALADPELEIYRDGVAVAYNDDWVDSELAGAIANTFSLAPADARESVIIHVLDRGAYTAIVRGFEGETGIGLVEVFQLGHVAAPQAQVMVNNQTGAALCYEVHGSGIGERCFGPGEYSYGIFEAGTYAYTVRGFCGSSREVQDYPSGHWSHSFWCEPVVNAEGSAEGSALGQRLEDREAGAVEVR